jgi:surfactin synthase thioesterase subunit
LVVVPHAGGSAGLFREWPGALPADVEVWAVQYPGRERRIGEPPARDITGIAEAVAAAVAPLLDRPAGVFGHSMGATVGYEVLRLLERREPERAGRIAHFFASARQAPHVPRERWMHLLPDDELCEVLIGHGGMNAVVFAEPELRELFLPIVRNDYRIAETHVPTPVAPPLAVDLTVLTGADDASVDPAAAARWAEVTTGAFHHEVLPGGHFYLMPERDAVAGLVAARLRASAGERGGAPA